jgi:phage repressor protein C with HTH and peptisase S24 domain
LHDLAVSFGEESIVSKSSRKSKAPDRPQWASKILELRQQLNQNQTAFGQKFNSSAMAVSRWERGTQEPPSHHYIEIGNLAGDPQCWYFWGRAALRSEDVMKAMPGMERKLRQAQSHDFEIVCAGSGRKKQVERRQLVAIPLLKVVAASHGEKGNDEVPFLQDAPVEGMIAAPKEWCPNPSSTSCLRVRGNSMAPTISDGYIVAVDSSQNDRRKLDGKIVIVWKKDAGLIVSRFRRYDHTVTLQSENSLYGSITLGHRNDKWKIVAKVLWWIGQSP